MAVGPDHQGSILASARSGLRYITNFFTTPEQPPQYKTNEPWNNPITDDSQGLFRIYYQNVHGIPRDNMLLDQDLRSLAEHDVGCYCLSETNLDWKRHYVRNDFLARQRKTWQYAKTAFSSIDLESSSDYMTGGTVTSAVGSWSSTSTIVGGRSIWNGTVERTRTGREEGTPRSQLLPDTAAYAALATAVLGLRNRYT